MSTNNFAFENRCVVVEDDDYEFGNVPEHREYVQGSNRNYPSYYLDEYRYRFYTLDIVLTSAYYSGGCIDYLQNDSYLDNFFAYENEVEYIAYEIIADFKAYKFSKRELRKLVKQAHNAPSGDYKPFDALFEFLFELEKVDADKVLDQIKADYGYTEVCKIGSFSNGEALYEELKPQAV